MGKDLQTSFAKSFKVFITALGMTFFLGACGGDDTIMGPFPQGYYFTDPFSVDSLSNRGWELYWANDSGYTQAPPQNVFFDFTDEGPNQDGALRFSFENSCNCIFPLVLKRLEDLKPREAYELILEVTGQIEYLGPVTAGNELNFLVWGQDAEPPQIPNEEEENEPAPVEEPEEIIKNQVQIGSYSLSSSPLSRVILPGNSDEPIIIRPNGQGEVWIGFQLDLRATGTLDFFIERIRVSLTKTPEEGEN